MRLYLVSSTLVLTLLAGVAGLASAEDKKVEAPGQWVDLSQIALPVATAGRLRNYVFVGVRMDLTPQADAKTWRDKEPYFRDALVRAAHRTPFTLPGELSRLDEPALKRAMLAEAVKITGPGVVARIEVVRSAPQRRLVGP